MRYALVRIGQVKCGGDLGQRPPQDVLISTLLIERLAHKATMAS
jgi:hypothetical protein